MRRLPESFHRYVAIGDSSTEGIDDPAPAGGWRGWSRRLAERIARQGPLEYANFGVRGCTTHEIRDEQLRAALALEPDLVTFFSGTNDVLRPLFRLERVLAAIREVQEAIVATGAVALTFTLPDLSPLLPIAGVLGPRIRALNDGVRRISSDTGTLLVDFAAHQPVSTDPRLWSDDRLHANSDGHARIADALAEALALPGANGAWREPLPPQPPAGPWRTLQIETSWAVRHLGPWVWLGLSRSRSAMRGAARVATLERIEPA